jgi:hypothetical protein
LHVCFQQPKTLDFVGLSYQEESNFAEPFLFGLIGGHSAPDATAAFGDKLNRSEPSYPRAVFAHGVAVAKNLAKSLRLETAIVVVGSEATYRSLWIGGILFLCLDAERFDPAQAKWMERELLVGRYSARYVVVVTTMRWFSDSAENPQAACDAQPDVVGLMPRTWRRKFLKAMQESGVKSIFVFEQGSTPAVKRYACVKRVNESESNLDQYVLTNRPDEMRIGRALDVYVVSDDYSVDQLPKWFNLAIRSGSGAYAPAPQGAAKMDDGDDDEGF